VVGVIHSDEDYHYRHFERLGSAWNACVCVSKSIQAEASIRYPDLAHKLVLIPNAVQVPSTFLSRESSPEIRLIYSGRLDQKQKRILDLVDIALELRQLKVPFRFTIVGDGGTAQELRSLVESANLSQSILFLGTLPLQDVLNLYEKNDIILLTSDFEGTPMAILEAMARGCVPVCTTERSGLLDLIVNGQNGFSFDPGDILDAVCAIRRLSENEQLYRKMSYSAWKSMVDGPYNRDRQVQEYSKLFNAILNGHSKYTRIRGKPRPPHFVNASFRAELKSAVLSIVKPWVFQ
jgi:glycosyltransferase involved in cell wall biosynthesis